VTASGSRGEWQKLLVADGRIVRPIAASAFLGVLVFGFGVVSWWWYDFSAPNASGAHGFALVRLIITTVLYGIATLGIAYGGLVAIGVVPIFWMRSSSSGTEIATLAGRWGLRWRRLRVEKGISVRAGVRSGSFATTFVEFRASGSRLVVGSAARISKENLHSMCRRLREAGIDAPTQPDDWEPL